MCLQYGREAVEGAAWRARAGGGLSAAVSLRAAQGNARARALLLVSSRRRTIHCCVGTADQGAACAFPLAGRVSQELLHVPTRHIGSWVDVVFVTAAGTCAPAFGCSGIGGGCSIAMAPIAACVDAINVEHRHAVRCECAHDDSIRSVDEATQLSVAHVPVCIAHTGCCPCYVQAKRIGTSFGEHARETGRFGALCLGPSRTLVYVGDIMQARGEQDDIMRTHDILANSRAIDEQCSEVLVEDTLLPHEHQPDAESG